MPEGGVRAEKEVGEVDKSEFELAIIMLLLLESLLD